MALVSWLRPMLQRIETTNTPRPDGGTLAEFPGGIEKLRLAILKVQSEQHSAAQEAHDYDQAWAAAQMEYQAAVEKNRVWQSDINARLYKLRAEWLAVSEPLGIEAQIKRAE